MLKDINENIQETSTENTKVYSVGLDIVLGKYVQVEAETAEEAEVKALKLVENIRGWAANGMHLVDIKTHSTS